MKKKTIAIGALLLAMNSFGQTDTLVFSVSGKNKYEFDYKTQNIKNETIPKTYKDFKFKLKKNEFLYLDLFDNVSNNTLYILYRTVTIYYRNGYVENLYVSSDSNTLKIDGSFIKKITVYKPELK